MRSTFTGVFLSNSAKHKKFDGSKQSFDFDYADLKDQLMNIKSWNDYTESDLHPYGLICSILSCIGITYMILAGLSSIFLSSGIDTNITLPIPTNPDLIIEIEEVLGKLIDLRKNGNMKEYEAFLSPSMEKYCLHHLGNTYLNLPSLESFHMNVADMISFIARGNKFTEHTSLGVNQMGGIIDPSNGRPGNHHEANWESVSTVNSKPCPLLDALYQLGAADKKTYTVNVETKPDTVDINTEKKWEDTDYETRFDQRYSWKNMEEFLDLVFQTVSGSGECLRIAKELSKDNMKSFILNFYEMADLIGREIEKERESGELSDEELDAYRVDPKSNNFRKYVIGREGTIYETDVYDNSDNDEYLKCQAVELVLNDKFVLDENLSYTNVKIAIDEKFNEW
eukprot:CAMPEP_0201566548 /NCGR_PEP_ID=MMETSP0190_2-20130828/6377_1 /ASSEMBLY_ACC=CAM_ASM_000263 /TAXON_ID=37353 /ORGANISM="Rosalina sp." /LENGTH=395 /DNA_ID=CAMNT_0047985399 /DNA_START=116 /DNA_END=1300 /DNA_ORIENTATION=+